MDTGQPCADCGHPQRVGVLYAPIRAVAADRAFYGPHDAGFGEWAGTCMTDEA
jgi:hypothetical protein